MTQESRVAFLRGKRTILRPVMKTDLSSIVRWINDPEVRRFISTNFPQTEEDEEEWLRNLSKKKGKDVVLVVETLEGVAIGLMGIHQIHDEDRTATTGALIGESEYWGKGLGKDAKKNLLNYAFNTLNLRKISSRVIAYNERSLRYSLSCGYKEEGRLKAQAFREGQFWDVVLLAIFREDFEPVWQAYQAEE